ncbi:hypothetical protein [Pedobacter heparinus]|uniref:hypothetical protein n=1 Tax=Pedobacter heparinus TaxID=984 RepID=UPI002931F09F|nr:hypothetical protein [Pedobacter heparinus]
MMKHHFSALVLFFSIFCGTTTNINAQERPLKVTYTVNSDKTVAFEYEKTDPGSYTVILKFRQLSNCSESDEQELSAVHYSGSLLTLKPTDKERGIGFSYTYASIRGKLRPKYDADFIYILPCKKGTKVKVSDVGFLGAKYFGNTTPEDWKVYKFYTQTEDTVTAVRKGIVVSVKDLYETGDANNAVYSSKVNEMIIEHADGTLATYKGFKHGSIAVKEGQTVFPGTALGINSQSNANSKPGIILSVSYLKSTEGIGLEGKTLQNSKSLYGFVTPHFYTDGNANEVLAVKQEYTAADSPDILKKEFTKKELKQRIK